MSIIEEKLKHHFHKHDNVMYTIKLIVLTLQNSTQYFGYMIIISYISMTVKQSSRKAPDRRSCPAKFAQVRQFFQGAGPVVRQFYSSVILVQINCVRKSISGIKQFPVFLDVSIFLIG